MNSDSISALKSIGYPSSFTLGYRDSFAFIGGKHNDMPLNYKHSKS